MCDFDDPSNLVEPFNIEDLREPPPPPEPEPEEMEDYYAPPVINFETNKDFCILPEMYKRQDYLLQTLSLEKNPFMAERFQQFMHCEPRPFVKFELYRDATRPPSYFPRRFSLTGQPFDKRDITELRLVPFSHNPHEAAYFRIEKH